MAADYTTTGSTQTIKVQQDGSIIDAEIVKFTTKPHGVHAQVVVPLKAWKDGRTNAYVEPVAKAIEAILTEGLASGATFAQDVDEQTNYLADFMDFTVRYEPKGSSRSFATTVRIPVSELARGVAGKPTEQLHAAKAT